MGATMGQVNMEPPTVEPTDDPAVRAVAALEDGLRRRMYDFIRDARQPVTREQAATAVGISRKLAAFHLDKLVDVGLLRTHYESGATRRVGRAPKVYEPTDLPVRISIPARQPDTLADILLDAVLDTDEGETPQQAALRVAHARGEDVGTRSREQSRTGRLGAERALTFTETALRQWGFEPARTTPTCVRLRNCPFHPFAAKAPDLVCGINHAFLDGFLTGLHASTVEAVLEPTAGECCVQLRGQENTGR